MESSSADLTLSGFVSYKEDIAPSTETLPPHEQVWISRYAIRPEFRRRGLMKAALEALFFGWVKRYMGIKAIGAVRSSPLPEGGIG